MIGWESAARAWVALRLSTITWFVSARIRPPRRDGARSPRNDLGDRFLFREAHRGLPWYSLDCNNRRSSLGALQSVVPLLYSGRAVPLGSVA